MTPGSATGRRGTPRERGRRGSILALAAAVVATTVVLTGPGTLRSLLDRIAFERPLHPDRSQITPAAKPQVPRKTLLVYRRQDGQTVRVLADGAAFSAFVRQEVVRLESARVRALDRAEREVLERTAPVFEAVEARAPAFADWYFAWSTSYLLMGRAAASIASHAFRPGAMALDDAVSFDLETYLERRYRETVLRPEITDPRLAAAYRGAAADLYRDFRDELARFDERLQAFIGEQTTYLDESAPSPDTLAFDWEHQATKLSAATLDRGFFDVARGAGLMVAGIAVGRAAGSGTGGALAARISGPYVARGVATLTMASVGAAAGPVGAVLGGAAGIGADWLLNEGIEALGRERFETEMAELLALQRTRWSRTMTEALRDTANTRYEDLIQLLARYDG